MDRGGAAGGDPALPLALRARARATGGPASSRHAPRAAAVFPEDFRTPRACVERSTNPVRYTQMPRGGHFAYVTDPELVVDDLRAFFGGR